MTNHVKIHGVIPRIQYTADGVLTAYEFPFAIFDSDDLNVYLNDQLQSTQSYTVSGVRDSSGGTVTFLTPPLIDTTVTIVRNLSIERTTDFQEGGALRADVLNDELDYQIACQQQIADNLNRSMVLPPYATDSNVDLMLPMPEAGKAIVWNASGTNLENSTVSVNALESTLKGYKTAAQAAATEATDKASVATTQANIATNQANIAEAKASEAIEAANHLNTICTNCLTEIPQDINLELSDGTLKLKSGSIITYPDGTQAQITQDRTASSGIATGTYIILATTTYISWYKKENVFSGETAPTGFSGTGLWYDTTNNLLKRSEDSGSTWTDQTTSSLPIAVVSANSGFTSIDQVFNGFGYIGSTIFALPGVKGLIPNGRNEDGTLKSTGFTINSLLIATTTWHSNFVIALNGSSIYISATAKYDEKTNTCSAGSLMIAGSLENEASSPYKITSFYIKQTFHALDYQDALKYQDFADKKATTVSSATKRNPAVIIENYKNTSDWYRIWSDGWIEQGGVTSSGTSASVTFLKPLTTTNYTVLATPILSETDSGGIDECPAIYGRTTTGFNVSQHEQTKWVAFGY